MFLPPAIFKVSNGINQYQLQSSLTSLSIQFSLFITASSITVSRPFDIALAQTNH